MYLRIALIFLLTILVASCGAPAGSIAVPDQSPTPIAAIATPEPSTATPAAVASVIALAGEIVIDGSSTVFPITEAAVLAFRSRAPNVQFRVGVSGTGGGFRKFCAGETMLSGASRPINANEIATCVAAGIEFIELPVAFDGLSVVVHPSNTWALCMTVDELKQMWETSAEGQVMLWSQVHADWPAEIFTLYGPGADSGTYDYFTQAIIGTEGRSRGDFVGSEDDYLLAQDIAGDPSGLGFFGYTYYQEYVDQLRLVAINNGSACVEPSLETIADGSYQPLSRPIFIYVRSDALAAPALHAFVEYYLQNGIQFVTAAGAIPLPPRAYELNLQRLERGVTGSVFDGGSQIGVSIEELLELEAGP
ncbi:MAG: PstS family phosphate ABC transporter substrate-binding protein [Oscillochloris sp.]|nr:PstS family phosphate ABC transporter substrate-binding protein [Oscillochloris sp.]